jgi:putative acetyltransferase
MNLSFRQEIPADYRMVEELTREAFWNLYVPGCDEHFVLHNLRRSPDFIPQLDLVAEDNQRIVGHIIYTRGWVRDENSQDLPVLCFGPVSVRPELQKIGVGSALIRYSIDKARSLGFPAIFIYGDPRYYHRFGFHCAEKYDIKTSDGKYAIALLALELIPGSLDQRPGRFVDSPAFQYAQSEFAAFEATFPLREKFETESQQVFKFMLSMRY